MKYLIAAIAAAALSPFVAFAAECPNLTRTLSFGSRGTDVAALQRFLVEQGHLSAGNDTGYFGRMTESAVRSFQCKEMGLCQGSARENGYGAVGPRTRAAIARACTQASQPQPAPGSVIDTGTSQFRSSAPFSGIPTSGAAPLTVLFTLNVDWSSAYSIDFGDGTSAPVENRCADDRGNACGQPAVSHTYTKQGTFTASLKRITLNTCRSAPGIDCPAWYSREDQVASVTLTVTPRVSTNQRPCTFNTSLVPHGASVTAYQNSTVPAGSACVSETRTCSDGMLSGTYAHASCAVAAATPVSLTPTQTPTLLTGLREIYAPSVYSFAGRKRMVLGGWLTDADRADYVNALAAGASPDSIYGPDKIFYSEWNGSQWTAPVLAFRKMGAHVNDGTVVAPPSDGGTDRSQWRYMYYTILRNSRAVGPQSEWFHNHEVGLASSVDGGQTWTDIGTVILPQEAGDGRGAWAPGAIVVGNEIWVYYHTGTQDFSRGVLFRQKFHANGWQKLGPAEALQFPADGVVLLSNVDVSRQGSTYVLLGNSLDLKNVERYISSDGISWRRDPRFTNPLMGGGVPLIITPHADVIDDRTFDVYFGWNPDGVISQSHSIHAWRFVLPQ